MRGVHYNVTAVHPTKRGTKPFSAAEPHWQKKVSPGTNLQGILHEIGSSPTAVSACDISLCLIFVFAV